MGKFDGILLCSDIDGTFTGSEEIISANKKAVDYFKKEGGKFTFTTGRSVEYLKNSSFFDCINAPACLFNGSIIYDYEDEKVLREKALPFTVGKFAQSIYEYIKKDMMITAYNGYEDTATFSFPLKSIPADIIDAVPLKMVCRFCAVEDADKFKEFAMGKEAFKDCYIAKSWNTGVEFNSISATKGEAVKFIKKHLKTAHTSIGIGDYENDIPLLTHANIGVAVGNALDSVKAVSDIIVKRNDEYAIADLINIIEKKIAQSGKEKKHDYRNTYEKP